MSVIEVRPDMIHEGKREEFVKPYDEVLRPHLRSQHRAAFAAVGRDAAGFGIAKRVYVVVDDNGDRARHRLDAGLERIHGRRGLAPWGVWGPPAACVGGLGAVAEAVSRLGGRPAAGRPPDAAGPPG